MNVKHPASLHARLPAQWETRHVNIKSKKICWTRKIVKAAAEVAALSLCKGK